MILSAGGVVMVLEVPVTRYEWRGRAFVLAMDRLVEQCTEIDDVSKTHSENDCRMYAVPARLVYVFADALENWPKLLTYLHFGKIVEKQRVVIVCGLGELLLIVPSGLIFLESVEKL